MPVLLIPGFMAGDLSLSLMGNWLRRLGYEPCRAGMRANIDCTGDAIDRLERELERLATRHARPAGVIGHSRGG
ncbi:MAG: esterase/lipase family protein, partial [Solirubrobacteraceae bacterium]